MSLPRAFRLLGRYAGYRQFKKYFADDPPAHLDIQGLRSRVLELAQEHEPRGDRSELIRALSDLNVVLNPGDFSQISPMLTFLTRTLFRDISGPLPEAIRSRIAGYDGPKFLFVGHTSYFDYAHTAELIRKIGINVPIMHVSGTVCRGWVSNWLPAFRYLEVPKNLTPVQHRAYSWFTAALAEKGESQALFSRTSRYTVRSRDGILREPYVPHGVLASVKASNRALVIPVAISYSCIPEDAYLTSPSFFPILSMLPTAKALYLPLLLMIGKTDRMLRGLDLVFGEVATSVGEPFELTNDNTLNLQRISHRAIEEVARNKFIHPSQLVAKSVMGLDRMDLKTVRERVESEIESVQGFFRTRYRKEPPFHPVITSDLDETVRRGLRTLTDRVALKKSSVRRYYVPGKVPLLNFYAYHADRRIYPLRGRNTMTVVNAGVWGYTLALHIGINLLKKDELSEHSVILYDSREDLIEKLTVEGHHPWHFKEMALPRSVRPEADLRAAIGDTSLVLVVTPSKYFHSVIIKIVELALEGTDLIIATKGFIPETGLLPCQTAQMELDRLGKNMRVGALSGANLAHEIVHGGAGVTQIACESYDTFQRLRPLLETPRFKVVYSADVMGTAIAAALKNVYAIGFGILEGSKKVPENFLATYATLVTAEIRQFGMLLGAVPETFDAESQVWMADLLATCRGGRSANFGRDLAAMDEKQAKSRPALHMLEQYRKKRIAIEGFEASRLAHRIATQRGFHPPILGEIYAILHGGKQIDVDSFIDKCLDALTSKSVFSVHSLERYRSVR